MSICEKLETATLLKFNPNKTQCIRFSRRRVNGLCSKSVIHLGHTLTADLKDDSDIYKCSLILSKSLMLY